MLGLSNNGHVDAPMSFHRFLGLSGVAPSENPRARAWGRYFEYPMLLVALIIPVQWYLEAKDLVPHELTKSIDWTIWLFFVTETAVLTALVHKKSDYLKNNWLNLVIIIAGLDVIWDYTPLAGILRGLRLLLLVTLLAHFSRSLMEILGQNRLGSTLAIALVVTVISGILVSGLDPGIGSPIDGIWWAWVTVTTVGYGDVSPKSGAGRIFAGMLILLGIGLISVLTANISAFLIGRDQIREERELRGRLHDIQQRLERIEASLAQTPRLSPPDNASTDAELTDSPPDKKAGS